MTDSHFHWEGLDQEDPLDSGLVDGTELVYSESKDQRRSEIKEILHLMEQRLSSGKHDPTSDPDFFIRKMELEAELEDLYF